MKKQCRITQFMKNSNKEVRRTSTGTDGHPLEDESPTKADKNWVRLKPFPVRRRATLTNSPRKRLAGIFDKSAERKVKRKSRKKESKSEIMVKQETPVNADMEDIDDKTIVESADEQTLQKSRMSDVLQINTELLISPIKSQHDCQERVEEVILSDSSENLSGIDSDETSYSPEFFKTQSEPSQTSDNSQAHLQTSTLQMNSQPPQADAQITSSNSSKFQTLPTRVNDIELQWKSSVLQSKSRHLQSNSSKLQSDSQLLSKSNQMQCTKGELHLPLSSSPVQSDSSQQSLVFETFTEKPQSCNIEPELDSDRLTPDSDLEELMMSFAEEDTENDWEKVRRSIIDKTDGDNNNNRRLPYYLKNTHRAIHEVLSDSLDNHCFNITDLNIIHKLVSASLDCQLLYCRLLLRNYHWIPVSKMCYEEITSSVLDVCSELTDKNLLLDNGQENDLNTLLEMLTQDDLKTVCKDFKLKWSRRGEMITSLLKLSSKPSIFSSKISITDKLINKVRAYLPICYQLTELSREVMLRIISVNSLAHRPALDLHNNPAQSLILSRLYEMSGDVRYPRIHCNRKSKLFMDREHLIQFTVAENLQTQLHIILDKKKYHEAEPLCEKSLSLFTDWLDNEPIRSHDQTLPTHLRRFSCITMMTHALGLAAEIYEKLRLYDKSVEIYTKLLMDQNEYGGSSRGVWWDRYCLILDHHLKQHNQVIRCIYHGLTDQFVRAGHKRGLFRRFNRIHSTKKIESCFVTVILKLSYPELRSPEQREIHGMTLTRSLPGSDRVNLFVTADQHGVTPTSVEQVALDHYLKDLNFTHGVHAEGSVLLTLYGLIFWDIIYNPEIPDTYFTNIQTEPLDFQTTSFYKHRNKDIEERLQQLKHSQVVSDLVQQVWEENHGIFTSLVKWELFPAAQGAIDLINCIGVSHLSQIFTLFLTEFKNWRSGLPDLTVWNPHNKTYMFVEVKGPGDKLSEKQMLWFDFFVQNQFSAEVCHVKGSKRDISTK